METYIQIDEQNIGEEHICCAISDKKCSSGYEAKKSWLKEQFKEGYVFKRLDARAKVFIEYGPAETSWVPINANNYININCFWVSGKYKNNGHAKQLLKFAWDDVINQNKQGLVTVVGTKKFHFMSDTKWFLRQGFVELDRTDSGFSLLVKKYKKDADDPSFKKNVKKTYDSFKSDLTVFYSNRCPFTEFHIHENLKKSAKRRGLSLSINKLENNKEALDCPSPATIFSLFYKDQFVTTNVSVCMDKRFDKIMDPFINI